MMRTIWKWAFDVGEVVGNEVVLRMPGGTKLLTAQRPLQGQDYSHYFDHMPVLLWGIVDSDAPMVKRHINIFGTGNRAIVDRLDYLGTIQYLNGLVFHFFDNGESPL